MKTIRILHDLEVSQGDFNLVKGSFSLEMIKVANLINIHEARTLFELSKDIDLIIFPHGGNGTRQLIDRFKENGTINFFKKIKCPKVYWSHDSHLGYEDEKIVESYFDRYYIAHLNYMHHFSSNARWLPPCYTQELSYLLRIGDIKLHEERDVVSIFNMYKRSPRNPRLLRSVEIMKKKDINYLLGTTTSSETDRVRSMLNLLKTSHISLNIPYSDDLNIRNFESIAMSSVLLAMETSSHKHIDLDYSHTYFFKPDLSDFEDALEAAMADKDTGETWKSIAEKHAEVHRVVEIINTELGTDFTVQVPWDEQYSDKEDIKKSMGKAAQVSIYDQEFILAHSIITLIFQTEVFKAVQQMKNAVKKGVNVYRTADSILEMAKHFRKDKQLLCGAITLFTMCELPKYASELVEPQQFVLGNFYQWSNMYCSRSEYMGSADNYELNQHICRAALEKIGIVEEAARHRVNEYSFIEQLVTKTAKPVVLDLFAKEGLYSLVVKEIQPDSVVYAFEPSPSLYKGLQSVSRQNRFFSFQVDLSSGGEKGSIDYFLKSIDAPVIDLIKLPLREDMLQILEGARESIDNKLIRAFHFVPSLRAVQVSVEDIRQQLPGYALRRLLPLGQVDANEGDYSDLLSALLGWQNLVAIDLR